jgi:hypothetical protein
VRSRPARRAGTAPARERPLRIPERAHQPARLQDTRMTDFSTSTSRGSRRAVGRIGWAEGQRSRCRGYTGSGRSTSRSCRPRVRRLARSIPSRRKKHGYRFGPCRYLRAWAVWEGLPTLLYLPARNALLLTAALSSWKARSHSSRAAWPYSTEERRHGRATTTRRPVQSAVDRVSADCSIITVVRQLEARQRLFRHHGFESLRAYRTPWRASGRTVT